MFLRQCECKGHPRVRFPSSVALRGERHQSSAFTVTIIVYDANPETASATTRSICEEERTNSDRAHHHTEGFIARRRGNRAHRYHTTIKKHTKKPNTITKTSSTTTTTSHCFSEGSWREM